jgi:type IV pilus assembly protein PilB
VPAEDFDEKALRLVGIEKSEAIGKVMAPGGCPKCNGSGFKGRKAIFEMMKMNAEIRDLAFSRAPVAELRQAALRMGMRDLLGDGRLKILDGTTTPEEIAKYAQADTLVEANMDSE